MNVENSGTVEKGKPGQVLMGDGYFVLPSGLEEKPYLLGSRCTSCGEVSFPKVEGCPACQKRNQETVRLSRIGKLYTYTIIRMPTPGYDVPYAVGIVDLPDKVRIFSQLATREFDSLRLDMDMEIVIEKIREDSKGNDVIGYKFKPLET